MPRTKSTTNDTTGAYRSRIDAKNKAAQPVAEPEDIFGPEDISGADAADNGDTTASTIGHQAATAAREGAERRQNGPTAMTQADGASLATAGDRTRTLSQSDMVMPRLALSQAMSKVNSNDIVRQGNFYHTMRNENLGPEVFIVPLDMQKSLSFFITGEGVSCRSYDLIQGVGDPGIRCDDCSLKEWGREDGRNIPPKCQLAYNYPVLVLRAVEEDGELVPDWDARPLTALWTARGTAVQAAKAINSNKTSMFEEWFESFYILSAKKQSNLKGTFYVPSVEHGGETEGDVLALARKMASRITPATIQATLDQEDGA